MGLQRINTAKVVPLMRPDKRSFYALALLVAVVLGACSGGEPNAKESKDLEVEASVTAQDLHGVLDVSLGPLVKADRRGWFKHGITVRNLADRPVKLFDDSRTFLLGDDQLLLAPSGCEPASGGGVTCALVAFEPTLEPQKSAEHSVTLFRDLEGMNALSAGEYSTSVPLRYSIEGGPTREGSYTITYQVK